MSSPIADQFRSWFVYEKDAHAKTLAALRDAPDSAKADPGFQECVSLMAHIVVARTFWLYRLGFLAEQPATFFPNNLSLDAVTAQVRDMEQGWDAYLDKLDDTEVNRRFRYDAFEGPAFENSVAEVLAQLFGHSISHRGQIALRLRQMGAETAATDYIFWCRKAVEAQ